MEGFLVSRSDRFGARMIPLINAIRLGRKLGLQVNCIWEVTDEIPEWSQIFSITWTS